MDTTEAALLATELMKQHGLLDWNFEFDRSKRRFGLCSYRRKTISLSLPITRLNDLDNVRDTILHEIAHALAGSNAKHGRLWRIWCTNIGANPTRCYSSDEVNLPADRWHGTCPSCGVVIKRTRRTTKKRQACTVCCKRFNRGRFDERFLITWRQNTDIAMMKCQGGGS